MRNLLCLVAFLAVSLVLASSAGAQNITNKLGLNTGASEFTVRDSDNVVRLKLTDDGEFAVGENCSATSPNATAGGGLDNLAGAHYTTVSGGYDNTASEYYATIAGGYSNRAQDRYTAIAGGRANTAAAYYATVAGGYANEANSQQATIAGGRMNTADADYAAIGGGGGAATGQGNWVTDIWGTIAGGSHNQAGNGNEDPNDADFAIVGGGADNIAFSRFTTVAGGGSNTADARYASIGGGRLNTASAKYAVIGGGDSNLVDSEEYATVGGGHAHTTIGSFSTIGGGDRNQITENYGTIAGGAQNIVSSYYGTIGGGQANTATGTCATIGGGYFNTASGDYSFTAGRNANANQTSCFLWNDSATTRSCSASNQIMLYYGGAGANCHVQGADASWTCTSDREMKENFQSLDTKALLQKLVSLPVWEYNMKGADTSIRHVGPVSQDFSATFRLGNDDKGINTFDAIGVTMASVQGLYEMVQEKDAQIRAQAQRIEMLESELARVQEASRTAAMENAAAQIDLEARLQRLEEISSSRTARH